MEKFKWYESLQRGKNKPQSIVFTDRFTPALVSGTDMILLILAQHYHLFFQCSFMLFSFKPLLYKSCYSNLTKPVTSYTNANICIAFVCYTNVIAYTFYLLATDRMLLTFYLWTKCELLSSREMSFPLEGKSSTLSSLT